MTKYGTFILNFINESTDHPTVEQIFEKIREEYPGIALASVYNNVNRLVEEGRIRRITQEGFPDCYDKVKRHDHLVCIRCGALADITFKDLTGYLENESGEKVLSYDLKVKYVCPKCRKKNEEVGE